MPSLKRLRTGDDRYLWNQMPPHKRLVTKVCREIPPPLPFTQKSRETRFQDSIIALTSTKLVHCLHRLAVPCEGPNESHCCACADDRPACSDYLADVRRTGRTTTGKRWHAYCGACKIHWEGQAFSGTILQSPLSTAHPTMIYVHFDAGDFKHTVKIAPSVDFSFPGLMMVLSRVLGFFPHELAWKDNGEFHQYTGSEGPCSWKETKSIQHIRCRVQLSGTSAHEIAEPDLMEGVEWDMR
ncbi:hypothetical protein K491DRAFT_406299 [Lophiostoma macrostomum CBS 122681]|uniref:Uncharacterized protein n=1 Tax=Lophiostoma macrostomum CBS 122681 TaxID=1314788 RepID=A0A6A6T810_9PLEO|nr:hypothetical protein K491DRAFT_406299 [Lophiostoma macrostomum CBS 122681]